MTIRLTTPRLILRPIQDADLESFVAYRSDPNIARYQGWDLPYTLTHGREFIEGMREAIPGERGTWYQLVMELKATDAMIGDCAFHVLNEDARQAEIGFTLAAAYQKQGYAQEGVSALLNYLFYDLGLHRVRGVCDTENLASTRLLERLGMRREAHFVENFWANGHWESEYWYGLLRREWEMKRG